MLWFGRPALYFKNITLLNPAGAEGRSVRVKGGRVVGIDIPPARNDVIIDGQGGVVVPGLINAHDHLELNTFKRLKYRPLYGHSRQWIEDIEARFDDDPDLVEPRRQPLVDRLWVGAAKNLLSGVTTVCHHNPLHKALRRNYPLRVVKNYGFCHSLFRGEPVLPSYRQTKSSWPWLIHLAEGVDDAASQEFEQLDRLGAVQANTILIHGVGLTAEQRCSLAERGGGLVWCPASNDFMFGRTAQVAELAAAGKLALGSDSRLSGSFDLLAELRAAQATGQLAPAELFGLVTHRAARLLGLTQPGLGRVEVGGVADLVLLPPPAGDDLAAHLLQLRRAQLELVMVGGRPLVGSPVMQPVFSASRTRFVPVRLDQSEKLMAQGLARRLQNSRAAEPGLSWANIA
jgi:cytosine/adenosine deaminase-related metal-dependent hydrolase